MIFAKLEFTNALGPLVLAAVAVLVLVRFAWRSTVPARPWRRIASLIVRSAIVVLIAAAFAGPIWREWKSQRHVIFIADRSLSASSAGQDQAAKFVQEALAQRGEFNAGFVSFADSPSEVHPEQFPEIQPEHSLRSNPAAAVSQAAAFIPASHVPELVLLTDGRATDGDLLEAAAAAGVPIHVVPIKAFPDPEASVESIDAPLQVEIGSAFEIRVVVRSNRDGQGVVKLRRGEQVLEQTVQLSKGTTEVLFQSNLGGKDRAEFTAELHATDSGRAENDRLSTAVFVLPRLKALIADNNPAAVERLSQELTSRGFEVDVRAIAETPESADLLRPFDLVILSNASNEVIGERRLAAIETHVREQEGGLIMLGGNEVFGAAAFKETQLEQLAPIAAAFERKRERASRLALVLVIDLSNSMLQGNRLPLAKDAAKQAINLLDKQHNVGLLAFGDQPKWISEMQPCENKPK
ncbi:MAG: VWA domain-containing protein, partial [Planctomycetales bacterium]